MKKEIALRQFAVDTFTDRVFAGNPAAVCILDKWLDDDTMRKIAVENNLSETAFTVKKDKELLVMDFPSFALAPVDVTDEISQAIGMKPLSAYTGADLVCVLETEEQVKAVIPNLAIIRGLDGLCLHITAKGTDYDCVTRTFAPKCNVPEDPVCGRGYCHVVPFWAKELRKNELIAYQASARGGVLYCRYAGERTVLSGRAALFSESRIYFSEQ